MRLVLAVYVFAALVLLMSVPPSFSKEAADGKNLYSRHCENCHGPLAKSDIRGSTMEAIKYAMTDRMCGESGGNKLTAAELDAIARVLSGGAR